MCRLDLPVKEPTKGAIEAILESETPKAEAAATPSEAVTEDPDTLSEARVMVPQSAVEKFVKLPARPMKARATPQAPQVRLSGSELG